MGKHFLKGAGIKFLFAGILLAFLITTKESSFAASSNITAPPLNRIQNNADGTQALLGYVPKNAQKLAQVDRKLTMDMRIILPRARQGDLDKLLQGIYDPKSPNYHQFLTAAQFKQQFDPTDLDIIPVKEYFQSQGLTIGQAKGVMLQVSGPVTTIENIFGVHITNYQDIEDGTLFYAPDADPKIPVTLFKKISGIGGLNNHKFKSNLHQMALNSKASPQIGTGPCGVPGYSCLAPSDIYKAYNLNGIPANGLGQTVALFELDGYSKSDINSYDGYFNLPTPYVPLQNEYIDGFTGAPSGGGGSGEVTIDIEILTGVAPGLDKILVYEADQNTNPNAWADEWNQIASDNIAKVISCSWGLDEFESSNVIFDNSVFQQMAAQGQEVFVAAGDAGAYDFWTGGLLSVQEPAAQPYVTGVGISILTANSDGTYNKETASPYGGGGISFYQTIPSYQQGMISSASLGSTTKRNVPDVAFNADPHTAYSFYFGGAWSGIAGSSVAAPIWAGFTSLVNEGRANAGESSIGFINPSLYAIAQNNSNYAADFHDIIGGTNGYYPAVTGYDDSTGLGSFNGASLYADLVSLLLAPTNLNAIASVSSVQLTWVSGMGDGSYNVKRSKVSGGPYTVIASGLKNTNYIDTSIAQGDGYYYVVSANNSTGHQESINSSSVYVSPGVVHTITVSAGTNGTISPSGTFTVTNSSNQTFIITSNAGYGINQFLLDGRVVEATPSQLSPGTYTYTLSNIITNHTLQVSFIQSFIITASSTCNGCANLGGSISPSGPVIVPIAENQVFTISPSTNYAVSSLIVDGTAVNFPASGGVYTFNKVNAQHTIQANFNYSSFMITTSADGFPGGAITPSATVSLGSNFSVTVTPIPGYGIGSLTIDGRIVIADTQTSIETNPYVYTFNNVQASHSIGVIFIQAYTISINPGSNGIIACANGFKGSGTVPYSGGAGEACFIQIDAPYQVIKILLNGSAVSLQPVEQGSNYVQYFLEFNNVTADQNYQFVVSLPTNIITARAVAGGAISPSGSVSVNAGANQTFTVTPSYGYSLSRVLVDGGVVPLAANNTYTFNTVVAAHTITASFASVCKPGYVLTGGKCIMKTPSSPTQF